MKKHIIISVTSDLSTDQRVHRAALTLHEEGFDVILAGRLLKNSLDLSDRPYKTKRFRLWFNKGPLFYANYNLTLFFFLLFSKADILMANDLDTLLPNFLISRLKSQKLIYDSHEYYTGVPELAERPYIRGVWKAIEGWIFPKLRYVYTVNSSIASLYEQEYKVKVDVIRNLPQPVAHRNVRPVELRRKLNLPEDEFLIILQGNGINVDRGGEEAVQAMMYLENARLLIAGNGDVIPLLKQMVADLKLNHKVIFKDRMPFAELVEYTQCAQLGLTLDKGTNLNYLYSLPNKLFDYIQCRVPVLASDLVEIRKIIESYDIGAIVELNESKSIAEKINLIKADTVQQEVWKKNLEKAAGELNWEKEKVKFLEIIRKAEHDLPADQGGRD